ncbi:MAG TPA: DEAD/DEAH box helicase family protein [Chthoniobacteraceae bacterium]
MATPAPEQSAREKIDAMLVASGWVLQDYKSLNLGAGRGIAVREVPLKSGRCDYLLVVDRVPVGVVEAKKEGTTLSAVAEQSDHYAENLPDFLAKLTPGKLRFLYESTGTETLFRDERDPHPRSRAVFAFDRPETFADWLEQPETLRARLAQMPFAHPLTSAGMRDCQVEGITNLEQSFATAKPRALIQMATGAGKTFTACAFTYRLIKHAGAKRVLFLVDRSSLGTQARDEFHKFITPDDGRKFTDLYNVQHLTSNKLDPVCRVTICTIQRLYSMLRGDAELPDDLDEASVGKLNDGRPKEVAYNPAIPIEFFDFIVADECHRSIYNLWRQVLEYFDVFLIGLTATPALQTIAFFQQNLVMEYGHERAVADGVNVGYDVYRIRTEVTAQGGKVDKGFVVDKRSRATRSRRQQLLDEDLAYAAPELDRSVVVPSQIRTVLQAFRDALETELFPGRTRVPKTLIFAKDDSHAEDIVHLVREVFGRGNDFAKKITYRAVHAVTGQPADCEQLIREFRLSPQLRIAVTVDMIATGTDIKPLEVLLFLRDVRSRVYFEQMKGRGTRVLTPSEMQAVSGEDARTKDHFVIVDAVGVCDSDKTESRPLERLPGVALEKMLKQVAFGDHSEDTLTSLASRLARLDRAITAPRRAELTQLASGKTLAELSAALLRAFDPDVIAEKATGIPGASPDEVDPALFEKTRAQLALEACRPFDEPALRDAITDARQEADQIIDVVTVDKVTSRGFDAAAKEKAEGLVRSFREYIEQHHAKIEALEILYSRSYRQRLTEEALKELERKLRDTPAHWTPDTLAAAYRQVAPAKVRGQLRRFTDLVSLVRFALEQEPILEPFEEHVRQRFNTWLEEKRAAGTTFEADQLAWLEKMRDYISASGSVDRDHLEADNVLGPIYRAFGERLWPLIEELNLTLAA